MLLKTHSCNSKVKDKAKIYNQIAKRCEIILNMSNKEVLEISPLTSPLSENEINNTLTNDRRDY